MANHGEGPRVLKHPLCSRLFHWSLILGFLPAAATGFILHLKPGSDDFVNLAMKIHIAGAAILTIGCILYAAFCLDRVVAFIRRNFSWDDRDVGWMLVCGGYPQKMFLGKKIAVPPMGKINTGQKIFGICLLFAGPILILTGWILYAFIPVVPKALINAINHIHLILGIFMGLFLCAHIFLGVYNWGEFKAMFGDGTQPLSECLDHNPVWVEKDIEPVAGASRGKQLSV